MTLKEKAVAKGNSKYMHVHESIIIIMCTYYPSSEKLQILAIFGDR